MLDPNFIAMLTDDFLIERPARVADGYGGFTTTYSTVGTIKGRLDDEGGSEVLRTSQDIIYVSHRLFVFPNENIKRDDRATGVGRVLRVKMLRTEHEDHPLEVLCEEIDP